MPDARYRCLCLDANDLPGVASFWARVLGRDVREGEDEWLLKPTAEGVPDHVWIELVPEPRAVKNRLHLDLRLATPDPTPLLDAGAVVVREPAEGRSWWVLADPEGNEFCAFPPADSQWGLPVVDVPTPFELIVDSRDARAQATWWADRTGGTATTREGATFWWVKGAAGFPWLYWVFTEVPEPKSGKNRMHWDVFVDGSPDALLAAGSTLLRSPDEDIDWWILADPEGNEFCAHLPRS
jgi:hypothetical protein